MKMMILAMVLVGILAASVLMSVADHHGGKKVLRHVVAFKFKADAPEAGVQKVVDSFRALPSKIDDIKGFEWGTNVSPEKHDKGFTHMFTLTFETAEGRDRYLVHPDHKEFGKGLRPVLDDVFVIDYWAAH